MIEADVDTAFVFATPAHLQPWVEQVWYSSGRLDHHTERVLPSASTDIVANLGPPMRLMEGEGIEQIVGTTVTGLLTRPIVLRHPEVHEALGVRLSPHGIRAVLGVPAAAVRDLVVDLPDVLESAVDELVEVCRRVIGARPRLSAAIDWLTGRIARFAESGDELARWATSRLDASHGSTTVSELHAASGYGATRFNQRFRDELGITPKQYARLTRFRAALDGLDPAVSLAELALDVGYSDQSHMNRDFRLLGDTTPTEMLANRYPSGLTLPE